MGILHFNSGNIHLLDNLKIPASIVVNDGAAFSNRAMKKPARIDFSSLTGGSGEFRIQICRREIKAWLARLDNRDYMVIGVTYNGTPGYMILAVLSSGELSLTESIKRLESAKGIRKILLVDDNLTIIETYQSILQLLGYETFQFTNPLIALESMRTERFDLLISDYDMPGMTGLELLKNFYDERPGLPVIIISGSVGFPGSMTLSQFHRHMVSFMNKPVALADLSRSLEVMEFFYKLCVAGCGE